MRLDPYGRCGQARLAQRSRARAHQRLATLMSARRCQRCGIFVRVGSIALSITVLLENRGTASRPNNIMRRFNISLCMCACGTHTIYGCEATLQRSIGGHSETLIAFRGQRASEGMLHFSYRTDRKGCIHVYVSTRRRMKWLHGSPTVA